MTRIAVLADVHGNVPALEAVLDDLARVRPDEILVGGDLVGRGPQGHAVVRRMEGLGWPSVKGNHEDYLLGFRRGEVPDDWLIEAQWAASRWMAAELSDEDVRYIEGLSFSIASEREPELRLVHGSPRSNEEGLGPWCSQGQLEGFWDLVEEPLLVCAHTHRPLIQRFEGGGLVVNVGSVGLPFNGDRRAQYAILERRREGWEVELRQVPYDVDEILEIYETSGFLEHGDVTAHLLELELKHAVPLLVPFLKWAEVLDVPPTRATVEDFLDFHAPGDSLRSFFQRLRAMDTEDRLAFS